MPSFRQWPRETAGKRLALSVALATGVAGMAHAQDYSRIAPNEPAANPPAAIPQPPPLPPPAPPADADQIILPSLLGIRVLGSGQDFFRQGIAIKGVVIEHLPLLDDSEIATKLAAFLGKPLTLAAMQTMSRTIEDWYRSHQHPFVVVYIPEQNVTLGAVQLIVGEYHVGKVRVEGNQWFPAETITQEFGLAHGDTLDLLKLKQGLDFVNSNPFRQVNSVLEKSEEPLGTDILLQTQDRLPVRAYVGYENNGQPSTGHDRWNVGFTWGDAFWLDQQLSYQFTSSDNFWHNRPQIPGQSSDPSFTSHSLDWLAPLPWHDKLELFGFYAEAVPQLGPDLGQLGVSAQASLRYIVPLAPLSWLTHDVRIGYDFKTTNNNLEFGGTSVSATTTEVDQFPLIYTATATDPYGNTTLENTAVWSPGNLTPQNKDAAFETQSSAPSVRAKYVYDRISVVRATQLPENMSWIMRATTQFANHDLLVTEQLGAGGIDSVRGYDERAANGTSGILLSQEIRSPPFSIVKTLADRDIGDSAQLDAFWDYGEVHLKSPPTTGPSGGVLESVGMGLRYALSRYVTFRLEYGFQLRTPPGATTHSQFGQIQLTLAY